MCATRFVDNALIHQSHLTYAEGGIDRDTARVEDGRKGILNPARETFDHNPDLTQLVAVSDPRSFVTNALQLENAG